MMGADVEHAVAEIIAAAAIKMVESFFALTGFCLLVDGAAHQHTVPAVT